MRDPIQISIAVLWSILHGKQLMTGEHNFHWDNYRKIMSIRTNNNVFS